MKKLCIFIALAVLCLTSCGCPDCDVAAGFSTNGTTIFVTKDVNGTYKIDPDQITLRSSCSWRATNLNPEYLEFVNTSGEGGVVYLPVDLTQTFFDALAEDISQFPEDATGNRKIGSIRLDSGCDPSFNVDVYLKDFLVLSFDTNGGEGVAPKPKGFVIGEEITIPENNTGMTFSSKTFVGWNTDKDGKGDFYKDGSKKTFAGNTTLYAMWSGDGSSASARIHIYNRRTLDHVRTTIDEGLYYLVVADFNANYDEVDDEMFDSWERLGGSAGPFIGDFDGNDHTIEYHVKEIQIGRAHV